MVLYRSRRKNFSVSVYNWVFPIPNQHLKSKNGILVIEHPDYSLEDSETNRLVMPVAMEAIDLIENFPAGDGSYLMDSVHGIPVYRYGVTPKDGELVWLMRKEWGKRIGPVKLYCGGYHASNDWKFIGISTFPSIGHGMFVEAD